MQSLSERLHKQVNSVISAFNARDPAAFSNHDSEAMDQRISDILILCRDSNADTQMVLRNLEPLRVIACEIGATRSMIEIDAVIAAAMGDGIAQTTVARDKEFRDTANEIVTDWNKGNVQSVAKRLRHWTEMCTTEPKVSNAQEDCFPPLINIAQELGQTDILSRLAELQTSVLAQRIMVATNQELMPTVDHFAIDYPHAVTIETFMKCNAKCHFCPYPEMEQTSERAGVRMTEQMFEKIIDDLRDIPSDYGFQMNLSRVNEPLLDHRLFDFMDLIEQKLPQARVFLPSNGSTLTERNVRKLAGYKNFKKLMVSLNESERTAYEDLMGISFDRTVANLDAMHAMKEREELEFFTVLTTVMHEGPRWQEFEVWCRDRYPLFAIDRYPPTNWFGMTENDAKPVITRPSGCKDWYQLHILADGSEAQCCYDAEGRFGHGNVADMHVLELYNKDWQRRLRQTGTVRQSELAPAFCQTCDYA